MAVIFGEVGPVVPGNQVMDPAPFLRAVAASGASVCAWLWKCESGSTNSLLTTDCANPNDEPEGNFNWGSTFMNFAQERAESRPIIAPRERKVFMYGDPTSTVSPGVTWLCEGVRTGIRTRCLRKYIAPYLSGFFSFFPPLIRNISPFFGGCFGSDQLM